MPTCQLCSEKFSNREVINGTLRNLQRRRYCLTCSPYGARNTKTLDPRAIASDKRRASKTGVVPYGAKCLCEICGKDYIKNRKNNKRNTRCASCDMAERRLAMKKRLIEAKGGKCSLCGYSRSTHALQFHHMDPSTKVFPIGESLNRSYTELLKEVEKCTLVCANCHAEVHAGINRGLG